MKLIYNLFIALVCFGTLLTIYIVDYKIISNPYWFALIIILFSVGGWNFGTSFGKIMDGLKN